MRDATGQSVGEGVEEGVPAVAVGVKRVRGVLV